MRKPQPSLTKGQVIAQKMAEANLIVDHQSAKTPVAALIDSELDKKASTNLVANSSKLVGDETPPASGQQPEQTGELDDVRAKIHFLEQQGYVLAMRLLQSELPLDDNERTAIDEFLPKRALGSGILAPQTPAVTSKEKETNPAATDSAVQQEDRYTIIDTPDGEVLREPPENPISASPQTSEAAAWKCVNIFTSKDREWLQYHGNARQKLAGEFAAVIQSAIDEARETEPERKLFDLLAIIHRDGGHYRSAHGSQKAYDDAITKICEERIEFDEAARVEPTKKE